MLPPWKRSRPSQMGLSATWSRGRRPCGGLELEDLYGAFQPKPFYNSMAFKSHCKTPLRRAGEASSLSPAVPKLKKPLFFSSTVRKGTPLFPDTSCPQFPSLNTLQWLLLRSRSSEPHPKFWGHPLSYSFTETLRSATCPQNKVKSQGL